MAAGNSAPVVGTGAVVGSMIAVGQNETPPPPKNVVGVTMSGVAVKLGLGVGANVGVGLIKIQFHNS